MLVIVTAEAATVIIGSMGVLVAPNHLHPGLHTLQLSFPLSRTDVCSQQAVTEMTARLSLSPEGAQAILWGGLCSQGPRPPAHSHGNEPPVKPSNMPSWGSSEHGGLSHLSQNQAVPLPLGSCPSETVGHHKPSPSRASKFGGS